VTLTQDEDEMLKQKALKETQKAIKGERMRTKELDSTKSLKQEKCPKCGRACNLLLNQKVDCFRCGMCGLKWQA
jgi:ribosomal protein S27AE